MNNIDHQKDQFAREMTERIMRRLEFYGFRDLPDTDKIKLVILDAIEFGIQLGGMQIKQ